MLKNHGTFHGAPKHGKGVATLGTIGNGKGAGTKIAPALMDTGRKISTGKVVKVLSGIKKTRTK